MADFDTDLRPTALVVDDDGILRMDVAELLERAGIRTTGPRRATLPS